MGSLEEKVSYWVATAPETNFPGYPGGDLKVEVAVLGGDHRADHRDAAQAGRRLGGVVEAGRVACRR